MQKILIGGDRTQEPRLKSWLAAWGLPAGRLPDALHPAQVPVAHACAVIYACGSLQPLLPRPIGTTQAMSPRTAPLILIGSSVSPDLRAQAWLRIADPGPRGAALAAALKPCFESMGGSGPGTGFHDLVNHEMRTPLTAAGTALQTLAMQLARAGGPTLELVDVALRNVRRLERTVDWACDYMTDGIEDPSATAETAEVALVDLLEDLDDLCECETVTWSTAAGNWQAVVSLDRESWRRLLRQTLRAVDFLNSRRPVHIELSLLAPRSSPDAQPAGLLVAVNLPCGDGPHQDAASRLADEEADQLRRLLAFTVNPGLARRMELRFDIMRLAERLRLRLMVPLSLAESNCATC